MYSAVLRLIVPMLLLVGASVARAQDATTIYNDGGDVMVAPPGASSGSSGGGFAGAGTVGVEASPPDIGAPADIGGIDAVMMPEMACDFQSWVGMPKDAATVEVRKTGRPFRVLGPGSMATMDFSPARINLEYDAQGIVTRVFCG